MSEAEGKYVQIVHKYPDGHVSKFSNHMVVQHNDEGEFLLSFFEIVPPLVVGESEEEKQRQIDEIKEAPAYCVAKIVLTEERMKSLVRALADNLRRYISTRPSKNNDSATKEQIKHAS